MAPGASTWMERLKAPVSGSPGRLAALMLVGLVLTSIPRLLVNAAPIYPDSALYLHAGLTGESHFHLAFRYVAVAPLGLIGLFTQDPYLASRLHGLWVGALGVGAFGLAARVLSLSLGEALCLMVLHAADADAITLSGWAPLSDVSFAIAVLFGACAFERWRAGAHPAWIAAATFALLGTRMTGAFVLLGFALARPWIERGWDGCVRAGTWALAAAVAYVLVTGLWVAGDPLWVLSATAELHDFQLGSVIKPRDKQLTNLAGMLLSPRVTAVLALAVFAASQRWGKAHRAMLWSAAFVVLGLEVFDVLSDNLAVRPRRFVPVVFLLLPAVAVALRRSVGMAGALLLSLLVYGVGCIVAAGVELSRLELPYMFDASDPRAKAKWALIVLLALGLCAATLRRPALLALGAMVALTIGSSLTLHEVGALHRARTPRIALIAQAEGTCPLAIVQPRRPYAEMLGFLNRLLNGPCAKTRTIERYSDLGKGGPGAPLVFSQFRSHRGYRSELIAERWGFYRHTRMETGPPAGARP